ncbi:MAG: aminopeptidase P N-terminal domain-containing protein [Ignavibacteriales bacterium]|nr:aminopeptidase P N-terminal domain-containing protein [Ignavibacteriales bacterium]
MEAVPDGAAVLLGAQPVAGYRPFFQNNDLMYFSGVEIPGAVLVVDGRRKQTTLFFTMSEREARGEGLPAGLVTDAREFTGIEQVAPADQLAAALSRLAAQGYVLYTPFKPEELMREVSSEKAGTLQRAMTFNLWDGRLPRELQFVKLLRERFPEAAVKDCSPAIWDLRTIKSPAEIDAAPPGRPDRRQGHDGDHAGHPSRDGEWEVAALFEFVCKKEGAQDLAYNTIISSDENHPYLHYYKHDRTLRDGDFLVVDAGPDLGYYDVDISISYPANGKFTPRQREIYEAALAMERESVARYRPGVTYAEVAAEALAAVKARGFDVDGPSSSPGACATGAATTWAWRSTTSAARPRGPSSRAWSSPATSTPSTPDEKLGVRVEDTVVITEKGCENLTPGHPPDGRRDRGPDEKARRHPGPQGERASTDPHFFRPGLLACFLNLSRKPM